MAYSEANYLKMFTLGSRAPRMTITNTRTGLTRKMQFNPTELQESIGAEFARQTVPGLSHQVLQFTNTRNREVKFELFFDDSNYPAAERGKNPILPMRRWLRSLLHPRRGGGRVTGGSPRVLFTWPGFISFTCFVIDLQFTYAQFNLAGEPSQMRVDVTVEEVRDELRLMEDVIDLEGE